jgi:Response regulator containing a CheY-like receiver domain and an HTH DNA-binding domain
MGFSKTIVLEPSAKSIKPTTDKHEWWGWFGSMAWLFFMMYGHDYFLFPEYRHNSVTIYPFFFMFVFTLAIIAFGFHFGRDPDGLAHVALYTTPIAIITTAVFALFPAPLNSLIYSISPVLMAPALTRRVFGVLFSAKPGKQLTRYMSAITLSVTCYSVWLTIDLPKKVAFIIPALLAVTALFGIRRTIVLSSKAPDLGKFKFSGQSLFVIFGALILLLWLNIMGAVFSSDIVTAGLETWGMLFTVPSSILPVIGFLLFGILNDKGYERAGLIGGMTLFIIGILIALLPTSMQLSWLIPSMIANSLSGSYFEFFILTIPIYFLVSSKHPVFTASLGVVANLIYSALVQISSLWLPKMFWTVDTPVLLSSSISAIGFIVLVFFLFRHYREKTLAAALYSLLQSKKSVEDAVTDDTLAAHAAEEQGITNIGLTPKESEFALLLLDGKTRSEIIRKLRIKSSEATTFMVSIRDKISGGDPDPVITSVTKKYKLTNRDIDMLRCLRKGMSNPQIALEFVISEATVKNHVYNLINKLPVTSRQEIPSWLETID